MGLFRSLVLLPLAPAEGVVWIARQIQAQADREMFGAEGLLQALGDLQADLDGGRIDEDEYRRAEEEILDRLDALEATE